MNASSPHFNPVNAAQPVPAPARQGDADPKNKTFGEILSGEIAQQQGDDTAVVDTEAASEAASGDALTTRNTLAPEPLAESTSAARDAANPALTPGDPAQSMPFIPAALQVLIPADPSQPASGNARERSGGTLNIPGLARDKAGAPRRTPGVTLHDDPLQDDAAAAPVGQGTEQTPKPQNADARTTRHATHATPRLAEPASSASLAENSAATAAPAMQPLNTPAAERLNPLERTPEMSGTTALSTPGPLALTPSSADPATANRLTPSLGTAAWNQALGDKMVWMAAGAQQTALLTLNPPDLGPLQIVLNLSSDQASASFFAPQAEVRHALEAALPKLRDMLHDAGIQLGQASVSADTAPRQDPGERPPQRIASPFVGRDERADTGSETIQLAGRAVGRGRVDTFA